MFFLFLILLVTDKNFSDKINSGKSYFWEHNLNKIALNLVRKILWIFYDNNNMITLTRFVVYHVYIDISGEHKFLIVN